VKGCKNTAFYDLRFMKFYGCEFAKSIKKYNIYILMRTPSSLVRERERSREREREREGERKREGRREGGRQRERERERGREIEIERDVEYVQNCYFLKE
jgi:hypothetical protein